MKDSTILMHWSRLWTLLDLLWEKGESGDIAAEEVKRLRKIAFNIAGVAGLNDKDLKMIDFDNETDTKKYTRGLFAEHAFEVIATELITKDPGCKSMIESIKEQYPYTRSYPR